MKNNKQLSRLLTILLTLTMVFTSMGLAAFADETDGTGSADTETAAEVQDVAADPETTEGNGDTTEPGNGTEEPGNPADPVDPVIVNAPVVQGSIKAMTVSLSWDVQAVEGIKYAVEGVSETAEGAVSDPVIYDGIEASEYKLTLKRHNATYHFRVGAYVDAAPAADPVEGVEPVEVVNPVDNAVWSEVIDFVTPEKLTKPTGVKFGKIPPQVTADEGKNLRGDNLVTISWKAPDSGEVAYYALLKDGKVLKSKIKASKTSYEFRAPSGTHKYSIRAYWKEDKAKYTTSSKVTLKGIKSYIDKVHSTFDWVVTVKKSNTPLYKSSTGSAVVKKLKAKTKAVAIGKYPTKLGPWDNPRRVKVKLSDGTTGWLTWGSIRMKADVVVKKDYPVSLKEKYVKNFSSKNSYLIWVNEYTQRINIFKGKKGNWKLVRSSRCTTGCFHKPLSHGTKYSLGNKVGRVERLNENGRAYYFLLARGFHGSGYFHTRCWWVGGGIRNSVTSQPSTRGCIRLHNPDAGYVWDMPRSAKVVLR